MQELQKIEEIPAFLEPLKDKFNALVDAVIELSKLSGDDGRTITIENGVIRCTLQQSSGGLGGYSDDEYNGYFKVISSRTGFVKVVNGADITATVCGSFTAGHSNISCTATELSVSGAGVVYIRIYKSGSTYQYEFGFAATLPSVVREIYKALASTNADGVPAQVWTGGAITDINGSYVA